MQETWRSLMIFSSSEKGLVNPGKLSDYVTSWDWLVPVNMNLGWKHWWFFLFLEYKLHNLVFLNWKPQESGPYWQRNFCFPFHVCVLGLSCMAGRNGQPSGKSKTMGLGFELLIQVLCVFMASEFNRNIAPIYILKLLFLRCRGLKKEKEKTATGLRKDTMVDLC